MKKKPELQDDGDRHLQILKAVAQAWQTRTGTAKPETEVHHRRSCRGNPSRFKIEAMRSRCEIVAVSKRLERWLVLDDGGRFHRRRRHERFNGFRNLFIGASSSTRFNLSWE